MGPRLSRYKRSETGESRIFQRKVIYQTYFRATTKGFKPDQLDKCMDEYEKLDVWQINQAKTKLTFIN